MVKYKTIPQFSAESGYTEKAIRNKIADGVWPEGQIIVKAPDNRILIIVEGYNSWVEQNLNLKGSEADQESQFKSTSGIKEFAAKKPLSSSPPPLI